MRKDVPLAVEMPSPDRDRPAWVKVGVIAAVGFVVGIAWPRLVGIRLGPSAPGETAAASASASAAPAARAAEAPPASLATATAPVVASATGKLAATAAAAPVAAAPPKIVIARGHVLSCKTRDGEKRSGKECGAVAALDKVVKPRVHDSLKGCSALTGQTGKLSLVVSADFGSGKVSYDVGKSSTVPNVEAIDACLRPVFQKASIASGVPHEHPRYTVSYMTTLAGGEAKAKAEPAEPVAEEPAAAPEVKPAAAPPSARGGEASVAWEVALVRDQPKVGVVVARLPRGTKVKLGSMKEGWYAIKYGDDLSSEGWVYRGAVGR